MVAQRKTLILSLSKDARCRSKLPRGIPADRQQERLDENANENDY